MKMTAVRAAEPEPILQTSAALRSPPLPRIFLVSQDGLCPEPIHLSAYVGDDPVNRKDPTGKSCVENGKGGYQCRIDEVKPARGEKELTPQQRENVRGFEERYTRAVNSLMSEDRKVTVGPTGGRKGTSFEISSREVGKALIERKFEYRVGDTKGTTFMDTRNLGSTIRVYERAITRASEEHLTHEGIHRTGPEKRGNRFWQELGKIPYAMEHQVPYNDAARRLLGDTDDE